jgi:membrane-associated phospholipid phosphatase
VIASVAVLVAVVAAGALATWHEGSPIPLEVRLGHAVDRLDIAGASWGRYASFARNTVVPVVTVGLAAFFAFRHRWRAVAACGAVPLAVGLVEYVLKPAIGRKAGNHGAYLYPSGQAAGAAATATILVVLVASRAPSRLVGAAVVCLAFVGAVSVAAAVVGSHSHLPLDAIGGLAFGTACALGWCLVVDAAADRTGASSQHAWSERGVGLHTSRPTRCHPRSGGT